MAGPTQDGLRQALTAIKDPASERNIVDAGLVEAVQVANGLVQVSLLTDRASAPTMEAVRRDAEALLTLQPGVTNATVVLTAHKPPPPAPTPEGKPKLLAEVGAIVAVASGKGGVGKSTVAVNLAVALARQGLAVGLLDADIYGPSLPRMLGLARKPEVKGDKMIPLEAWGLKAMSLGFLAPW